MLHFFPNAPGLAEAIPADTGSMPAVLNPCVAAVGVAEPVAKGIGSTSATPDPQSNHLHHDGWLSMRWTLPGRTNKRKKSIAKTSTSGKVYTYFGECVCSDICGEFPESPHGFKYACNFYDRYSHLAAVYFCKTKTSSAATIPSSRITGST